MIIRLAEEPAPDGRTLVSFGQEGTPGWFSWQATDHELEDLEAVLALRKARVATCPAERGEHACVWTPGHAILHQCRACPERWR